MSANDATSQTKLQVRCPSLTRRPTEAGAFSNSLWRRGEAAAASEGGERPPSAEHLAEIYPGGHQLCLKAHTSQAAMRFSLSVAVGQYYYLSFPNGKTETRRD